jgi:pyruvate dehydrogenase E1 component beta subunit
VTTGPAAAEATAPARRRLNYSQCVAEGIGAQMELDPSIVVLGEDVGRLGGVFGATRNLQRRFGEMRVRDTPISELGFVGMAAGLAMAGYRPLVEIMFVDFVGVCLEPVYNAIAKNRYMSGGRVRMPVMVKTAGGCIGSAAQHSQCLWATFAHLPGLKVVAPSSPYDAKGLAVAALVDDDPVVFVEHKALHLRPTERFSHGSDVPSERYLVEIGRAATVRTGSDATVVTLSASVSDALEAAGELAGDGIEAEVIDLRSLVPLDTGTIVESVSRTGRLLVVDEDYLSFGLSGEVIARVVEALGPSVLRAVGRLATPDVPIPAALTLEQAVLPGPAAIAAALRRLVGAA